MPANQDTLEKNNPAVKGLNKSKDILNFNLNIM